MTDSHSTPPAYRGNSAEPVVSGTGGVIEALREFLERSEGRAYSHSIAPNGRDDEQRFHEETARIARAALAREEGSK